MPTSPKEKMTSEELKEELYRLRHKDKKEFYLLVSRMVAHLANVEFRELAGQCASWPVNVPVRQSVKRSKAPTSSAKPDRGTREGACEWVLDDLLQVGAHTGLALRKRKPSDLNHQVTALAHECLCFVVGFRAHDCEMRDLKVYVSDEDYKNSEWTSKCESWIQTVQKLPDSKEDPDKWVKAAERLADLRRLFECDVLFGEWESSKEMSPSQPKTYKARVNWRKKYFRQAAEGLIERDG